MQASMILADAARGHDDGTFSLLRGGINRAISDSSGPIPFRGSLVVRIVAEPADAGDHPFHLRLTEVGGQEIPWRALGPESMTIPPEGGVVNVVADIGLNFPRRARYLFEVLVSGRVLASWPIEIVPR